MYVFVVHSQQALESTCSTRLNKALVDQCRGYCGNCQKRKFNFKGINLKHYFREWEKNNDKLYMKIYFFRPNTKYHKKK